MAAGYTQPEAAASQREFDILRNRVEQMDAQGTRGVGALQIRMDEVVKDLAEMQAGTRSWQKHHEQLHLADEAARAAARRFTLTTTLAVLGLLVAILAILVTRHPA